MFQSKHCKILILAAYNFVLKLVLYFLLYFGCNYTILDSLDTLKLQHL